jgi:putative PIN family toxin of toxin-antitoxin system
MMKVVLDCNVIIGAGLKPGGTCYQVIRETLLNHRCIVSKEILEEYRITINKPKLRKHRESIEMIANRLEKVAEEVTGAVSPFKLADSDDEIYLEAAISAQADILITGDLAHFSEPYYGTIRILRPHEFLSLYGK